MSEDSFRCGPEFASLPAQLPVVLPVLEVTRETARMVSVWFPLPQRPSPGFNPRANRPGQFVMVWIPRLDEKPYVISALEGERFGVTVLPRGPFSSRLAQAEPGTPVGFRGPYGNPFSGWEELAEDPALVLIGGGCGMAPLRLLIEQAPGATVVQGAPTAEEVLFRERFPEQIIYTEDGSAGRHGLPTTWLRQALARGKVKAVYTCGPEPMMSAVVAMCRGAEVPCQAALERYMKCGIGLCGQCECNGRLVCRDGPVFSAEQLARMPAFGRERRDAAGRTERIHFDEECVPRPDEDE